jgi:MoxR-like ATPase
VATQNPIESEGVYPLPEAQRDRFLMRIPVDYPTPREEARIVQRVEGGMPVVARLLDPDDVVALQAATRAVHIDDATADYAVRLVLATRDPAGHGLPQLAGLLEYGASPRASLGLVRAAKALALLRGRSVATPQDVYDVAYDVLNLRLVLSYRALAEGLTIDDVLVELLSKVWAPATPMPQAMTATPLAPATPSLAPAAPAWRAEYPATTSGADGGAVPLAAGQATPTPGPAATPLFIPPAAPPTA